MHYLELYPFRKQPFLDLQIFVVTLFSGGGVDGDFSSPFSRGSVGESDPRTLRKTLRQLLNIFELPLVCEDCIICGCTLGFPPCLKWKSILHSVCEVRHKKKLEHTGVPNCRAVANTSTSL